jgi:hypothetical protein
MEHIFTILAIIGFLAGCIFILILIEAKQADKRESKIEQRMYDDIYESIEHSPEAYFGDDKEIEKLKEKIGWIRKFRDYNTEEIDMSFMNGIPPTN